MSRLVSKNKLATVVMVICLSVSTLFVVTAEQSVAPDFYVLAIEQVAADTHIIMEALDLPPNTTLRYKVFPLGEAPTSFEYEASAIDAGVDTWTTLSPGSTQITASLMESIAVVALDSEDRVIRYRVQSMRAPRLIEARAVTRNAIELLFDQTVDLIDGLNDNISASGLNLSGATISRSGSVVVINLQTLLPYDYSVSDLVIGNLVKSTAYQEVNFTYTEQRIEDYIPPAIVNGYPRLENVTDENLNLLVRLTEPGRVYYLILPQGATPPSVTQIIAGQDANNIPVSSNKTGYFSATSTSGLRHITGLQAEQVYDFYIVAEDNATYETGTRRPNRQSTATRVSVHRPNPQLRPAQPFWPHSQMRGVETGVQGIARAIFSDSITHAIGFDKAADINIRVIEYSTGRDVYLKGSHQITTTSVANDTLTFTYLPLNPDETYTVIISANTVRKVFGGPNTNQISWTFFTERKPAPLQFFFEPESESFDLSTPFGTGQNQYVIPELFGVNKIGVGVNKTLAIDFLHPIKLLPNPNITIIGMPLHLPQHEAYVDNTNPSRLIVRFITDHTSDYLNHGTLYTIKIPPATLQDVDAGGAHSYNDAIEIKFETARGFKSTLLEGSNQEINLILSKLMLGLRNVAIDIPKVAITHVETIHNYQGLVPGDLVAPNLSHIDIMADEDVTTIKVETNRGLRVDLLRVGGRFSASFAGLTADASEITIYAYDQFGKLLERRSFRLGADLKKSDYIPPISPHFGRTVSLYDLLADPSIIEAIVNHIPVSQLNRIGVFYPYFEPYGEVR